MKNYKEAMDLMKKAISMMESENYPADEKQMYQAKAVQNAMDMGMQSPNAPNGEADAMAKSQGGFESNQVTNGEGQSNDERKKLAKAAMVQKYAKMG